MKSILSPYDDANFNEYLLQYIKKRLKKKSSIFTKDEERKYYLDKDPLNFYTPDDIIKSLELVGRTIRFGNQKLVNHAVYDLSQRFWYEEMKHINNIIRKIFLDYQRVSAEFEVQQRKLSHEKRAQQRTQGART